MTWDLLRRSITHGIVPGLIGGPWQWQRWAPASPWGVPPASAMVLGWTALALVVVVSLLRKQRVGMVWLTAAGYAVACQIPIYLMRSSAFTALELAQTLRYLPFGSGCWHCSPRWASRPRPTARAHNGSTHPPAAPRPRAGHGGRVPRQQPGLDPHVPGQLAGQSDEKLRAERDPGTGRRALSVPRADARSGSGPHGAAARRRAGEPRQSHMFALLADRPGVHPLPPTGCGCWTPQAVSSTPTSPGYAGSCRAHDPGAVTSSHLTRRCGCHWTGRCCPRSGRLRSTTWRIAMAPLRCRFRWGRKPEWPSSRA